MKKNTEKTSPGFKNPGGRTKLDAEAEHSDWKIRFYQEYLKEPNKAKAAAVTPYQPDTIMKMLDESDSSYDKEFHDLIRQANKIHLEKANEAAHWALQKGIEDVNEGNDRTVPRDVSHMAINMLKNAKDAADWGKPQDIHFKGHMLHEMRVQHQIEEITQDQRKWYLERKQAKALAAGYSEEDVLDVEAIPEKESARG